MDIRELAKEFTSKPGNGVVSPEMLVNFYNEVISTIPEQDPYEQIAKICGLEETGTDGCFTIKDGLGYYTKTKFGFIDIRSKYQR